jgi:SAM-dependent methyltransferase
MAVFTTPVAAQLVKFARVDVGETLLDVGTGTGVVAITAARAGARVTGLDLTPGLLEEARANAAIAGHDHIAWAEGDVEQLPYADQSFDVVLSQFGHMFAPHPEVAIAEMHRVLKPEGRIAFATWPPDELVGRMFALIGRHAPPLPPGASPPGKWGDQGFIAERLGGRFGAPSFERGVMWFPALSLAHYRRFIEHSIGPMQKLVDALSGQPQELAALRATFDAMVAPFYGDNVVRQDFLLTSAPARRDA